MSFKIGDRVRVKSLEQLTAISEDAKERNPILEGFHINQLLFSSSMIPYCGHVYTIENRIINLSNDRYFNLVDENGRFLLMPGSNRRWAFSKEMLEPVEEENVAMNEPTMSFEDLFVK